jgi:hypothetical protein
VGLGEPAIPLSSIDDVKSPDISWEPVNTTFEELQQASPKSRALTSLQSCSEAEAPFLIVRILGDGVAKEEELLVLGRRSTVSFHSSPNLDR